MAGDTHWDQSRFDAALDAYLRQHEYAIWPRCLNKKAFYVALAAIKETDKVSNDTIFTALHTPVTDKRQDGSTGEVPLGWILSAKRAAKNWVGSKRWIASKVRVSKGRAANSAKGWRQAMTNSMRKLMRGRMSATGFIRIGWVTVMKQIGPQIGESYSRGRSAAQAKERTAWKGSAWPARWHNLQVIIQNTAQARSDKRHGLITHGTAPLQRAMDIEAASMERFLEQEMKPEADKFNRSMS